MSVTILDVAKSRGVRIEKDGSVTMGSMNDVDLAIFGGCLTCEASIAAYNAYPSRSGYWCCADCVGDFGFKTVEAFEEFASAG